MRGRKVGLGQGQLRYINCGNRRGCSREMHTLVHTIVTIGAWRCTILIDFIIITIRRPQRPGWLDGPAMVHQAAHASLTCLLSPT